MIRIALATLALSTLGTAQAILFGGNDEDRKACTKFLLDEGQGYKLLGSVCIQYGQPTWKAEYADMAEQAKGKSLRLGKNYWTTLNTSSALNIAGTNVPAGAYYLGLGCDEKGAFQLLVLDAKNADAKAWTPFNTDAWKADYTCTFKHSTSKTTVEKLSISIEGDQPAALELKIAWGDHALAAPLQMKTSTANAKDAATDGVEKVKAEAGDAIKKAKEAGKKLPEPAKQ